MHSMCLYVCIFHVENRTRGGYMEGRRRRDEEAEFNVVVILALLM